jgi:hypothetical protein
MAYRSLSEVLAGFITRLDTPPSQPASPSFAHSSVPENDVAFDPDRLPPAAQLA